MSGAELARFAERLRALGLSLPEAELAAMASQVSDLEATAHQVRDGLSPDREPATVFRLPLPPPR